MTAGLAAYPHTRHAGPMRATAISGARSNVPASNSSVPCRLSAAASMNVLIGRARRRVMQRDITVGHIQLLDGMTQSVAER